MNYEKIKHYGRTATIGVLTYAMSGCANMKVQARIDGTLENPKPMLVASATLDRKVMSDAPQYSAPTQNKPWYSNKWVWIGGGVILAGGLAALLAGGNKGSDTPPNSSNPAPTPTSDPDPGDDNQ